MNGPPRAHAPGGGISHRERTQARALAMQALCLFDALGDEFAAQLNEFLRDPQNYEDLGFAEPARAETLALARTLAEGAHSRRRYFDELLSRFVTDWPIGRMQPVDRNILRLGLYELLVRADQTPPHVALNEAIELARQFGGTDSPAFVNGVLDKIWHAVRAESAAGPAGPAPAANLPG